MKTVEKKTAPKAPKSPRRKTDQGPSTQTGWRDSSDRQRAVQQRAVDTCEKIIEFAIAEFARHGFEGASVRNLAREANVQQALVTYHFKNKDGLWRACLAKTVETYSSRFEKRLEGLRGVAPEIQLRIMQEEFIRFTVDNLNFHRIMAHAASKATQQLRWLVDEHLSGIFKIWTDLIATAQAKGKYVQGDPYHLLYIFIGAVSRLFLLASEVEMITGRSPFDQDYVDEHVQICLGLFFRD